MKILCMVKFDNAESKSIDRLAAHFGMSREKAIRHAVKIFSAKCVPTQRKRRLRPR